MQPISAAALLDIWERGQMESPVHRGLDLLEAACPESTRESIASLPIGTRDSLLLTLRGCLFGHRLEAVTVCPSCDERVETAFGIQDIRAETTVNPEGYITKGDRTIHFRLPTSADLIAIADCVDSRAELLRRCAGEFPPGADAAICERMAELDPQAEVQLALACPACGVGWTAIFDIVAFFWKEIEVWARRMLGEVHALASAYGWSERDILAMNGRRRQAYLELLDR